MHTVAIVAPRGVVLFDLAVPIEVFGRVLLPDGRPGYRVLVCGEAGGVPTAGLQILPGCGLEGLATADTIMVPGVADIEAPSSAAMLSALQAAAAAGTRIASVCVGAFLLAEAGLLAGRRATTHWRVTGELARRYPAVRVDPNVLYIDEGQILTSAGAAAGLDLCLYMVRQDYGAAVAAETARVSVMPLERAGGQAQFIVHEPPPPDGASLEPLLRWIEENLRANLSLERIARQGAMSVRTLSRRFPEQTGLSPAEWIARARVHRAQHLLESTALPIDTIGDHVGFRSPSVMRARFARLIGVSPRAYRAAFSPG